MGKGHAINGMSLPTVPRYLVVYLFTVFGSYVIWAMENDGLRTMVVNAYSRVIFK